MSPGPCRFPARTRLGGLSTMDMKLGSSAGLAARGVVREILRLHAGHCQTIRFLSLLGTLLAAPELRNSRTKSRGVFIAVIVAGKSSRMSSSFAYLQSVC